MTQSVSWISSIHSASLHQISTPTVAFSLVLFYLFLFNFNLSLSQRKSVPSHYFTDGRDVKKDEKTFQKDEDEEEEEETSAVV